MRKRVALGVALLAAACAAAWAEQALSRLEEATGSFGRGDYSHAVMLLREIVLDPADSNEKAGAYFWLAKSYLALDNLQDGERSLEYFLSNYPNDPHYPEAFYEKGRLLFRQGDHENAIQVLQAFLERYPDSEFIPNAYFWVGEALYSLGQLDDALLAFKKVVDSYPTSFKVEAARYRIALIEFKKRENELLKLLKWSHEESLKTIEGFQRRETAYEQALAAYQRKLATYEQADLQKAVNDLKAALTGRESDLAATSAKLALAQAEVEKLQSAQTAVSPAVATVETVAPAAPPRATTNLQALLGIKSDALSLKEQLLDWMLSRAGNQ
jgi:TolA-binding protein